jgi:hypothetical protein
MRIGYGYAERSVLSGGGDRLNLDQLVPVAQDHAP